MSAPSVTARGAALPSIGFGTWQLEGDACADGVRDALALGYRHVDTARAYGNEREVGRGLAEAGVPRDEVFVTTKLWTDDLDAEGVRRQTSASLAELGIDRVDLLLIHWPNPEIPLAETLDAMREQQEEGLATHLGVSNFPVAWLERALEHADLVCNQVEYHPLLDQTALLAACRRHDVALTAYSPLAKGAIVREPAVREMAEAHGVQPSQVVLRWLIDQPLVAAVPKSASHERRAQNLDLWSFELTDADRERLDGLARPDGRQIDPSWSPDWD